MKLITTIFFFLPFLSFAQEPAEKLGQHPIYIVDSVKLTTKEFMAFDAHTIASVTILTDTDATNKFGKEAKDGVILAQTKAFARKHYLSFFRRKSTAFDNLYRSAKSDSSFVYIINDKIKGNNSEGDLASIDDYLFTSLDILTPDDLKKKYNITDKKIGILIMCRKPQNLFNGDKKF